MYARQATQIMEDRGFTPEQIRQFFAVYPDKGSEYTEDMINVFEASANGPVIEYLHPDSWKKI